MSDNDSYSAAKDFHSTEISTLNERTNFFLVTQSIFIGGLSLAFSDKFGYIVPLIISLLVITGEFLSVVHYVSGHNVAENMMR